MPVPEAEKNDNNKLELDSNVVRDSNDNDKTILLDDQPATKKQKM